MFRITRDKGFHMTFDNGWTVSVQWGTGNYGDHYMKMFDPVSASPTDLSQELAAKGSFTAEAAAWDKDGNWYKVDGDDKLLCYASSADVLAFMVKIAAL
jgi:hypothetical protein